MNRYSIEDQIERFGLSREDAEEKIKQIKNNIHKWNIYSIDDQMSKFGLSKEEAEEKIKQIKNVNVFSIEWQINKFGLSKEEAIEKIENIKNKLKESQSKMSEFDFNSMIPSKKEHWVKKGYSEEESNLKSNLNIKTATNNCNSFVEDKKLNPNKYIGIFNTSIDYYLKKGYSVEESKKLLKERQTTFTLEKCIKKYGEKIGIEKWKERQEKWSKSLLDNGNLKIGYSNISQIMFDKICENLKNDEYIFYGKKNKEISIANSKSKRGFLYDFTDILNKKIIEFNGDIYHGNPSIYNEDDKPNPFKNITAKKLWERDRIKIELAESNGFDVLVIWESEYKKDKESTIKKCLEFLK